MGQLNPTRQEILDAHSALEELKNVALSAADFCGDTEKYLMWKNEILKALPPKPQPTMAEIEWDEGEHFLAEAKHPEWGAVVMLYEYGDFIRCMQTSEGPKIVLGASREYLTPTGRRYVLQEGE